MTARKPAPKSKKVFPAWEREAFDDFKASLSPARLARDEKLLADLFNMAAGVPLLKEALAWARENDIAFIVDETTEALGYYNVGTGVVALNLRALTGQSKAAVTGTLVHELRHAWQDVQGMIPTAGHTFTEYYTKVALIEADAEAHGKLAQQQAQVYEMRKNVENYEHINPPAAQRLAQRLAQVEAAQKADAAPLWPLFKSWYTSWRPTTYGDTAARLWGVKLGVPGVTKKDYRFEYKPYEGKTVPVVEGIDFSRPEQLRRMGKGFSGASCKNYFNDAAKDDMSCQILSPGLAARFFSKARRPSPLVRELRRRDMAQKREKGFNPLIALG